MCIYTCVYVHVYCCVHFFIHTYIYIHIHTDTRTYTAGETDSYEVSHWYRLPNASFGVSRHLKSGGLRNPFSCPCLPLPGVLGGQPGIFTYPLNTMCQTRVDHSSPAETSGRTVHAHPIYRRRMTGRSLSSLLQHVEVQ